jgi:heat-inducible transcriptional repressor
MTSAEKRAIASILDGAVDLDDVVQRSVRLLAQLTHQVALVQYPTLSRSTVRHLELLALTPTRLLAVLILSSGRVEQRLVELPHEVDEDALAALRGRLAATMTGRIIAEASTELAGLVSPPDDGGLQDAVVAVLVEAMSGHRSSERVAVGGAANLARFGDSFELSVRPLLEALEEHVVLLKLLGTLGRDSDAVAVRIGHENPHAGLQSTSVVSTGYGTGRDLVAGLGVLGPTRMDYPTTMASVRAVARYVSEILSP